MTNLLRIVILELVYLSRDRKERRRLEEMKRRLIADCERIGKGEHG